MEAWQRIGARQEGIVSRSQLRDAGVTASAVRARVRAQRWALITPTVIATFTGSLTRRQLMWAAVLHAGPGALIGGLSAAELAGLERWHRDEITVLVPYADDVPPPLAGVAYVRSRRDLDAMLLAGSALPTCRLDPAILLFAASTPSPRSAQGVVAAVVQQRLTTPDRLLEWIGLLTPLRRAPMLRAALGDIAGGAQSVAELDVRRMCRRFRLALPARQVKRRDSSGRVRYTDCEWRLADGRTLVLEVDGGFHMEAEREDDLARQRALTRPDRVVVRCTARELRDEPESVARDLLAIGVPRAA